MDAMLKKQHMLWPGVIVALGLVGPLAVQAQETDTMTVRGNRIVIEVDQDGRLVIDGRQLDDDDGYVLFAEPTDDGSVVLRVGPEHAAGVFAGRLWGPRGAHGFGFWTDDGRRAGALARAIPEAGPRLRLERDLAPLLEAWDGPHVFFGDRMREHAEVADQEHEARELAREARQAEGAERRRLEEELRAKLGTIFDRKMELRQERIERLEREVQEQRSAFETRARARAEIIDRRLRELLGEEDVLDW